MIVLDASALVEALVGEDPGDDLLDALADDLHAPHLVDVEVLSVLRGLTLGRIIDAATAEDALRDLQDLTIIRHETAPFASRIWQLRHQFTAYDASYLALAEALGAPLMTCDRKLDSSGHAARIRLVGRSR